MVVLEQNRSDALAMARQALLGGKNVGPHLQAFAEERLEKYVENGLPVLAETMERGWDMHLAQTRSVVSALRRVRQKQSDRITPEDEQALNAIRERTADGRRRQLDQRNIDAFRGFDETQTEQIVQIVEDGLRDGKSFEQIAGTIRADHWERYGDQSGYFAGRDETCSGCWG